MFGSIVIASEAKQSITHNLDCFVVPPRNDFTIPYNSLQRDKDTKKAAEAAFQSKYAMKNFSLFQLELQRHFQPLPRVEPPPR
jgi:hypothetical protein